MLRDYTTALQERDSASFKTSIEEKVYYSEKKITKNI
jgi:hypothetical protein